MMVSPHPLHRSACLCVHRLTDKSSLTIWHHLARFLPTDNEAILTSQRLRLA